MAKKNYYDEDFKRTLVELYHNCLLYTSKI